MFRRAFKAFTLIELLVAIAILAILVGLLFPLFSSAREQARRLACRNNLRSMGSAMLTYMQQYGKGRFYAWPGTQAPQFTGGQWIATLYSNALRSPFRSNT